MKKILLMSLFLSCLGCQVPTIRREVASVSTSKRFEDLKSLKQRRIELSALSFHFQKKKNEFQLSTIQNEQKELDEKIHEIETQLFL